MGQGGGVGGRSSAPACSCFCSAAPAAPQAPPETPVIGYRATCSPPAGTAPSTHPHTPPWLLLRARTPPGLDLLNKVPSRAGFPAHSDAHAPEVSALDSRQPQLPVSPHPAPGQAARPPRGTRRRCRRSPGCRTRPAVQAVGPGVI